MQFESRWPPALLHFVPVCNYCCTILGYKHDDFTKWLFRLNNVKSWYRDHHQVSPQHTAPIMIEVDRFFSFTLCSKDEQNIWGDNFRVNCQNVSQGSPGTNRASTYGCPKTITCLRQQRPAAQSPVGRQLHPVNRRAYRRVHLRIWSDDVNGWGKKTGASRENEALSWCDGCVGFCVHRGADTVVHTAEQREWLTPLDSSPIRWCMSPTSFSRTTHSNAGWHTAGVHSNQRLHPFILGIQCSLWMCLKGLCDALR